MMDSTKRVDSEERGGCHYKTANGYVFSVQWHKYCNGENDGDGTPISVEVALWREGEPGWTWADPIGWVSIRDIPAMLLLIEHGHTDQAKTIGESR